MSNWTIVKKKGESSLFRVGTVEISADGIRSRSFVIRGDTYKVFHYDLIYGRQVNISVYVGDYKVGFVSLPLFSSTKQARLFLESFKKVVEEEDWDNFEFLP